MILDFCLDLYSENSHYEVVYSNMWEYASRETFRLVMGYPHEVDMIFYNEEIRSLFENEENGLDDVRKMIKIWQKYKSDGIGEQKNLMLMIWLFLLGGI